MGKLNNPVHWFQTAGHQQRFKGTCGDLQQSDVKWLPNQEVALFSELHGSLSNLWPVGKWTWSAVGNGSTNANAYEMQQNPTWYQSYISVTSRKVKSQFLGPFAIELLLEQTVHTKDNVKLKIERLRKTKQYNGKTEFCKHINCDVFFFSSHTFSDWSG